MSSKPRFVGKKVKLGDVCDVLNGFAFKSRQYVDKGIRIIRIANVQKGHLEDSKPCFYPVKLTDSLKQYILEENDLLVSLTGNVGRVALLEKSFLPAALNQRVACLRIKDESRICERYLYHALNSSLFENNCVESANGIAQKNMSTTWLKGYRIPAPSMVEQEIIIKQLDLIQRQISNVKRQLSEFDSLVKSRFVEMFGDLEHGYKCSSCKLESIAEVGSSKRVFKNELLSEGVPFYRGTEVAELSAGGSIKPSLFISKEHYERLIGSTGKPEIGDLLLPSICPGGQIWCVNTNAPFYFKDGRVLWIRPDRDAVDGVYLRHALSTMFQMSFSNIASGTTFAELKIFLLKELNVPLPELKDQKEFVSFASQVDKSRFIAQQQIEKLQMLYNSLAQDYFGD